MRTRPTVLAAALLTLCLTAALSLAGCHGMIQWDVAPLSITEVPPE